MSTQPLPSLVRLALISFVGLTAAIAAPPSRPPNIVVLLADDLGWGECGFQGITKEVPTPHLDRIAQNGIRFTNAYVAATYCSPSRAGFMTGRYPTRFGHEYNPPRTPGFGLPLGEETVADDLKALGYATCAVGKWHLGEESVFLPTKRGFDEYMGCLTNPRSYSNPILLDSLGKVKPGVNFYTTDAFGERAVDWIERNRERPFFLYVPFNAEHAPLEAPKHYLDRFPGIADTKRRTFAAMLSAMDDAVGHIMQALRDNDLEENTLVVFYSDNGGPTASTTSNNLPLRGAKMTTNEGGTRIPFVLQWKGHLPAGRVYDFPIIQLDLRPTFIALAGGKIETRLPMDGVNLLPYLTGEIADRPHQTLYWRYGDQWAIRDGDWKLVASKIDKNQPRLINLARDIGEANDLAAAEPARVKALTAQWQVWNAEQIEPAWPSWESRTSPEKIEVISRNGSSLAADYGWHSWGRLPEEQAV